MPARTLLSALARLAPCLPAVGAVLLLALPAVSAPAGGGGFSYDRPAIVATEELRISPDRPRLPRQRGRGDDGWFSIAPDLPAGLHLEGWDGVIAGRPTVLSPTTRYTVTWARRGRRATAPVSVTVNPPAPDHLRYAVNPLAASVGTAASDPPSNGGGPITSYTVQPALPPGLSLDPGSGLISGTPTAPAPAARYRVTGSNAAGSTRVRLRLTVTGQAAQPPATPVISAAAIVPARTSGLTASVPAQAGASFAWSLTAGALSSAPGSFSEAVVPPPSAELFVP